MEHTPGALAVRREDFGAAGYTEWKIYPDGAVTPIGCAYGQRTGEADARLLASSPKLLAELQNAYDAVYSHHSGARWSGELLDRLGTAIEAAAGVHPQESLRGR